MLRPFRPPGSRSAGTQAFGSDRAPEAMALVRQARFEDSRRISGRCRRTGAARSPHRFADPEFLDGAVGPPEAASPGSRARPGRFGVTGRAPFGGPLPCRSIFAGIWPNHLSSIWTGAGCGLRVCCAGSMSPARSSCTTSALVKASVMSSPRPLVLRHLIIGFTNLYSKVSGTIHASSVCCASCKPRSTATMRSGQKTRAIICSWRSARRGPGG